jgi:hypothetical protein
MTSVDVRLHIPANDKETEKNIPIIVEFGEEKSMRADGFNWLSFIHPIDIAGDLRILVHKADLNVSEINPPVYLPPGNTFQISGKRPDHARLIIAHLPLNNASDPHIKL